VIAATSRAVSEHFSPDGAAASSGDLTARTATQDSWLAQRCGMSAVGPNATDRHVRSNGRFRGNSGPEMLDMSFSRFDPTATSPIRQAQIEEHQLLVRVLLDLPRRLAPIRRLDDDRRIPFSALRTPRSASRIKT
jgi:hypothetical protein